MSTGLRGAGLGADGVRLRSDSMLINFIVLGSGTVVSLSPGGAGTRKAPSVPITLITAQLRGKDQVPVRVGSRRLLATWPAAATRRQKLDAGHQACHLGVDFPAHRHLPTSGAQLAAAASILA
jgi:hypothetical protein